MYKRPPLGLRPRYIVEGIADQQRTLEILSALERYVLEAPGYNTPAMLEWIDELVERLKRLQETGSGLGHG